MVLKVDRPKISAPWGQTRLHLVGKWRVLAKLKVKKRNRYVEGLCDLCLPFDDHQVYVPDWIANPDADLVVVFSSRAEQDLNKIDLSPCNWLRSAQELR